MTSVQAAEVADRLWRANQAEFHRQCAIARDLGVTLLELIRQRAEILTEPYGAYELEREQLEQQT